LRADLHAGVEFVIDLDLELQLEVAVVLDGAEKRVGTALRGLADDAAILGAVGGRAVALFPAVEVLAVEERHPAVPVRGGKRGSEEQGSQRSNPGEHEVLLSRVMSSQSTANGAIRK